MKLIESNNFCPRPYSLIPPFCVFLRRSLVLMDSTAFDNAERISPDYLPALAGGIKFLGSVVMLSSSCDREHKGCSLRCESINLSSSLLSLVCQAETSCHGSNYFMRLVNFKRIKESIISLPQAQDTSHGCVLSLSAARGSETA